MGSIIINLNNEQKVVLRNLSPSDIDSDNFIFYAQENKKNHNSLIEPIAGGVLAISSRCRLWNIR
jgi:hypothetical protein